MAQRQPVQMHRLSKYRDGDSGNGKDFERAGNLDCNSDPLAREETVLQCRPEAIAEGSRLRKRQEVRDSSRSLS